MWKILVCPFTFIFFLFGKRTFKEVLEPFRYFFEVLFEAKGTMSLIIINIIVFIISMLFFSNQFWNLVVNQSSDLFSSRIYTIITSGFLHANITHIVGNMLALLIFGRIVERELGTGKMLTIYFGALIISGVFSSLIELFLLNQNISSVGASGAIMGIISAAVLLKPWELSFELLFPLPIMFIGWIAIWSDVSGIITPVADGIGHFAHLGGYISVALLVFLVEKHKREQLKKGLIINIASILVILAILIWRGII